MTWAIVILSILLVVSIAFIILMCWAFKTAFKRNDVRIVDINSGPIAEYKSVFEEGLKYIEQLPCEKLYVKSFDGLRLVGRYYSNNNADSTILLFHGYRSDGNFDFSCAVRFYIELGLNVLVVNQRTNGESEGKLITFGIKERRDVLTWVEFINENYAPKNIFLSGVSMGATSVMMASNLGLPHNVRGIIADCGFTSPPEIIKRVASNAFKINATPIMPALNLMCIIFGGFNLYATTTTKALSESNIPIFFLHGKKDDFVPCHMTETAFEATKAPKYKCLVENADHGLSFLVDTENVKKQITDFVKKYSA